MAGAGVRLFTPGQILTADQVNQYLQDQVVCRFADVAARDAAFGGVGEPTLSEGRICYLDSDNTVYIYTGSAWVELQSGIAGTSGQVVVYDSSGDPIAQTLTGDVTISSSAVTSIAAGAIVNADVNASAAIAYSKLNLSGSITSSDIADGTIVNADINAAAAIDLDKLADAAIDEKSASYALVLADKNKFIKMSVATTNTVTVPTNASVAFPIGSQIHVIQYGTGKTQVIGVAGVNVYATPGAYLRAQYSSATLLKCDTNIWMLMGDLSAS
jgi:hypothetical protein